jgi:hypothetical protein
VQVYVIALTKKIAEVGLPWAPPLTSESRDRQWHVALQWAPMPVVFREEGTRSIYFKDILQINGRSPLPPPPPPTRTPIKIRLL